LGKENKSCQAENENVARILHEGGCTVQQAIYFTSAHCAGQQPTLKVRTQHQFYTMTRTKKKKSGQTTRANMKLKNDESKIKVDIIGHGQAGLTAAYVPRGKDI
jgi:hypothetical protein